MQIAIVLYPGLTALDAAGPYEVLRLPPDAEVRFVGAAPGLAAMGAKPRRGERIVHAGKVVTAAGVSAGLDLGLWLAGQIAGREHAETIQLYIEDDPQPPVHAGHPSKASKAVVGSAKTLGRRIASNPSEGRAVPQIAWQRVVGTFRKRKGLS